jgi:hypothetical protein
MAAKPDCVLFLTPAMTLSMPEAGCFGMNKQSKIAIVWGAGLTQYKAIGSKLLEDVIIGAQYDHFIDAPKNKHLVDIYKKKYNELPPYNAASVYQQTLAFHGH